MNGLSTNLPPGFVCLPLFDGFTNGACQVTCHFVPEKAEILQYEFSPRAMAQKGMQYIDEESLETAVGKCAAIRFQQRIEHQVWCKWAIFVPSEAGTHLFIATFDENVAISEQFSVLTTVFQGICFSTDQIASGIRLCEFREMPPFKTAHVNNSQTILTVEGVFPVSHPSDLVLSLSELPLSLLPNQFHDFIEKRLDSLAAIGPSIDIRELRSGVFAVTGNIEDQAPLQLVARYFFLRNCVFLAEVTGGREQLEKLRDACEATFQSIRLAR